MTNRDSTPKRFRVNIGGHDAADGPNIGIIQEDDTGFTPYLKVGNAATTQEDAAETIRQTFVEMVARGMIHKEDSDESA